MKLNLLLLAVLSLRAAAADLTDVFTGGADGYPAYRIPALVTTKSGALLAFAEGRATLRDHAENDIVMKRSSDAGKTWSPLKVIHEDSTNALNNPTAVVLRGNGRVLLMFQRYMKGFDERKAVTGYDDPRICRTFITRSDDDGSTWSAPQDVTRQVKPPAATSTASGPGNGIQLQRGAHAGRILIPFNHGPYGAWKVYAALSDDGGASWRYGETAPEGAPGFANEVQFVELKDGSVMLNARNQGGGEKLRKTAISRDGGLTWSATHVEPALIEPTCQGSLIRHSLDKDPAHDLFIFCNPGSQTARTNGTVRISRDEGATWPVSRILYPGSFAYCSLTSLPDGSIGCLFERDGTKKITFTRFTVDWVETGK